MILSLKEKGESGKEHTAPKTAFKAIGQLTCTMDVNSVFFTVLH